MVAIFFAVIIDVSEMLEVVVGLLVPFLRNLIKKHRTKKRDNAVKVKMHLKETKTRKHIVFSYEGPVSGVKAIFNRGDGR